MSIESTRDANSTDLWIRVTRDVLERGTPAMFVDEMSAAIRLFVQTDPEVRAQINEFVRTAFGQVDLLKLVTETVKQSVLESVPEAVAAAMKTADGTAATMTTTIPTDPVKETLPHAQ